MTSPPRISISYNDAELATLLAPLVDSLRQREYGVFEYVASELDPRSPRSPLQAEFDYEGDADEDAINELVATWARSQHLRKNPGIVLIHDDGENRKILYES